MDSANGLHAKTGDRSDPNFRQIGNCDLIRKRTDRTVAVPPAGTLSAYIPFYFTPFSNDAVKHQDRVQWSPKGSK